MKIRLRVQRVVIDIPISESEPWASPTALGYAMVD